LTGLAVKVTEVPAQTGFAEAVTVTLAGDEAVWVITTSSEEDAHVPLLIVQRKVFAPIDKPETAEVGLFGEVTVPLPLTRVHVPVPETAVFPANVAEEVQTDWSEPALATVGVGVAVTLTAAELAVQPLLVTSTV
jgi:hypothetical protein